MSRCRRGARRRRGDEGQEAGGGAEGVADAADLAAQENVQESGVILHEQQIEADAQGRFAFDRVPQGQVTIGRVVQKDQGEGRMAAVTAGATPLSVFAGQTVKATLAVMGGLSSGD